MKKSIMSCLQIGLSAFMLLWTCSCSVFRSSTQQLNITAYPPEAKVMVNGLPVQPPAVVNVKRDRNVMIQCNQKGYYPWSYTVGYHLNTTGVLDIIGLVLILVPGIGLLAPGAWSLDQDNINIVMNPIEQ